MSLFHSFYLRRVLEISRIQIAKELAEAVYIVIAQIGGITVPICRVMVGEYGLQC